MSEDQPISEAFVKICKLALDRGFKDLCGIDGCFEHDIDDNWHISLNAHMEINKDLDGQDVQPFAAIVRHKNFPVGIISPYGGALMSGAESDFIEALDAQIA